MRCERCKELLSWYLESDLQSEEIKEHLSVCKECSDELKLLEDMLMLIKRLPQIELPEQISMQLVEKVKQVARSKKVIYIWKKVQNEEGLEILINKDRRKVNYQFQTRVVKRLDGMWWKFVKVCFS